MGYIFHHLDRHVMSRFTRISFLVQGSKIIRLNLWFCKSVRITVLGIRINVIVRGGVQLGPLGTAATNRPIVSAPGDYHDGEIGGMIDRRKNLHGLNDTPRPITNRVDKLGRTFGR
jgi:hypothetical protein